MVIRVFLAALVAIHWLTVSVLAQVPAAEETPRQQVLREFERKAPQVGQPLGDLELLDAEGNRFQWESIRGQHAVLVFGCLT